MSITVLFVDDHEVFHECMSHLLNIQDGMEMIGAVNNGQLAVQKVRELLPDVVVMDLRLPIMSGIEATRQIVKEFPQVKILALSQNQEVPPVLEFLKSGASGYVVKDANFTELLQGIETVASGRMFLSSKVKPLVADQALGADGIESTLSSLLTERERDIVRLVAEGLSSKLIADKLCISLKTVETHRRNIMKKLGYSNIPQLVKYALREGLTSL